MVLNQTPSETGVDSANNAIHLSRHPIRLGFSMTICGQVMASVELSRYAADFNSQL